MYSSKENVNFVCSWNQPIEIAIDDYVHWRIGPLTLEIRRLEREWQIAYQRSDNPLDTACVGPKVCRSHPWLLEPLLVRYPMQQTDSPLRIAPFCADRAMIAKPLDSIVLPADQRTTIFVGSPIWVRVFAGTTELCEIPTWEPSKAWFGPSTMTGAVCYSTRTRARLERNELQKSPGRILTAVGISNQSGQSFGIDGVVIPLPLMSVFSAPDGRLWTEQAQVTSDVESSFAHAEMEKDPPLYCQPTVRVSLARQSAPSSQLSKLFGALIKLSV